VSPVLPVAVASLLPPAPARGAPAAPRPPAEEWPSVVETVRIPTAKLDPLLLQAEEMIQAKIAGSQRAADLRQVHQALVAWRMEWGRWQGPHTPRRSESSESTEGDVARLDALVSRVTAVAQAFEQDQRALRRMVDDHLEAVKQVLMLPVSTLVEVLPKLVRDLAREQGKEVELVMRGAEIEIDKRILEELKDPLIHLLRNCVDHGMEKPDARARQHKPPRGTIRLTFGAKDSRLVEIIVSDDGAGIDVDQVRSAAIGAGILSADAAEKLDPQETLSLIFQSGLSTSPIITDISGRGLGLAIVREKVEKLGGVVSVDTQAHVGTTFRLLAPLTLATFRGVLVRVREHLFVLPTSNVERVVRVSKEEIKTVENRETIRLDGQIVSLVGLGDVLGLPARSNDPARSGDFSRPSSASQDAPADHLPVVVLASAEKRIAVHVDEVLAEQEVLVKGLGKQLSRVRNIAGATVLGTGKVVPVLNILDLMKSAVRSAAVAKAPVAADQAPVRVGRILVAEDSITARTLLKNILETVGYQVATAVDGADAFTQARNSEFDLVVSDVDMPRLSGFELTAKIRGDQKLAELPVVLVTALESPQDRERGIDVGANAYIIKSSFDQSNLLEVIHRLL
jgi:two-component system chemotaxis sensor kinase CheA